MAARAPFVAVLLAAVAVLALAACSRGDDAVAREGSEIESASVPSARDLSRLDLDRGRVSEIIAASPESWLAAVQEVVDDSQCYGPRDGSSCFVTVRVVDWLASGPRANHELRSGAEYPTLEQRMDGPWPNRAPGRRRLVLATPIGQPAGALANHILVVDPTADEIAHLRRLADEAARALAETTDSRARATLAGS